MWFVQARVSAMAALCSTGLASGLALALAPALAVGLALGLATAASAQPVSVPHTASGVVLDVGSETFEVELDLPSLPARPRVRAIATPRAPHDDMVLDLAIVECDPHVFYFAPPPWQFGEPCPQDWSVSGTSGAAVALAELWECNPGGPIQFGGPSLPPQGVCTVRMTATSFGASGAPATVDLVVTGESKPVTGTLEVSVDLAPVQQQVVLEPTRDATIYENGPNDSNGAGQLLRAGGNTLFGQSTPRDQRALLYFDVESIIPFGATIVDARLDLFVQGASSIGTATSLHRVEPGRIWGEGTNDPTGTEPEGLPAGSGDATWLDARSGFGDPWTTPGGDFLATPSVVLDPTPFPFATWTSPALAADVEDMVNVLPLEPSRNGGWILLGPTAPSGVEVGFLFDSRESQTPSRHPMLTVDYLPGLVSSGDITYDRVSFITDADQFRWIYDDDGDDVVNTADPVTGAALGVCEVVNTQPDPFSLPYAYTFVGDPEYVGYDCCTWQSESVAGTTNSGQVYSRYGGIEPPGDLDLDGFLDPCDNCPWTPNGFLRGTCIDGSQGPASPQTCLSDLDCPAPQTCSMAQEDDDFDPGRGIACPEPSAALGLALGGLVLISGAGRRRPQSQLFRSRNALQ